jgi:UDP-GlcNAc:undecaprenyl-phosphate/decaprenyl-phosphate GlcNAc-1-phosphate transferase
MYGLMKTGLPFLSLDVPNERSVHAKPIRRGGGLAIVIGSCLSWILLQTFPWILFLSCFGLTLLSWFDDRYGLSVLSRLAIQAIVIAVFVSGNIISFAFMPTLMLFAVVIWSCNLYNFMDGADGLAGGMTIFGFGFYALAAFLADDIQFFLLCLSVSVSAIPFLIYNFPPAKIFMGDAGSIPLGFLAGALGYLGWHHRLWPLWYPLLVFSPFIADATITLIKRAFSREKFWLPHKNHYYQRFLRMGAGHRRTCLVEYGLMLACGGSALAGLILPETLTFLLLMSWLIIYAGIAVGIDRRWRMFFNDKT